MAYQNILLAVDFSEHAELAVERAAELARLYHARLYLVHVVEYLPPVDSSLGSTVPFAIDLTEDMAEAARKRLLDIASRLGIAESQCRIEVGSPKTEIIRIAEEASIDLIVLGSHGRRGLSLLLGSTASSVMHHAACDVLAVRLKN